MKKIFFFIVFISMNVFLYSQEIKVHRYVGKPLSEAVSNYGKPVHQDKSDPEMICTFYQTSEKKIVFISNSDKVYQAQADITYKTKQDARNALSALIDECSQESFTTDTLNIDKFKIHKKGTTIEANLSELAGGVKYLLSVKAVESED